VCISLHKDSAAITSKWSAYKRADNIIYAQNSGLAGEAAATASANIV